MSTTTKNNKYVSIDGNIRVNNENIPEGKVFTLDPKEAARIADKIITEQEYKDKLELEAKAKEAEEKRNKAKGSN